ncbi:hypothetical protein HUK81_06460 [Komagataeibacter swingsii]|uniref:Uncharacterized protein n=1 Tax=Komagataeibacter swingsii TaxID=215220 RepID=A0A850P170_9PROT|nr:hypothetical protein [Komagataeibacter swingsii]
MYVFSSIADMGGTMTPQPPVATKWYGMDGLTMTKAGHFVTIVKSVKILTN